ncbi:hypothetical protein LMG28688_01048 [Paraburkholderia caffeinitolerans]|uniref:DUF3443 domain-containing protein n=1 Tax=Paraburkholderia caffeinitolerans TaxID=1723730 RepID=A0A6J5FM22_9BURK|nr:MULTISPECIES: DUF3443 domain-containing protein [Paraburkholderia]CAB3780491.1 hypothetical protein LMG28688_01048 [Paraburkholderia caffeinitolerans]
MSIHGIPSAFVRALREPRAFLFAVLFALTAGLAACGGGGGGSSGSGSSSSAGGSGDTSSLPAGPQQTPIAATASNTVVVTVNRGITGNVPNIPTVSVTICVPNTGTCQPIDNIQVDTASFGLRLVASALGNFSSTLPLTTSNGATLAECTGFADGYTWGTVRRADVKIGGETASNIPIQVIGDLASSTVPSNCSDIGPSQNSVQAIGANGILGIGIAPWDCGSSCASSAQGSMYYACPNGTISSNCANTAVALNNQVANPVANFPGDNNGVILQMPPISNNGQASATGTLVFGIGTQSNNAIPTSVQRFATDGGGNMTGTYNGRALKSAFLDSGSNGLFFADSGIAQCGGNLGTFYCPAKPLTLNATLTDQNNVSANVSFNVVSAAALLNSGSNYALNDLAGAFGSTANLDLGLPFFYGRYVYYGYGQAPYVAF